MTVINDGKEGSAELLARCSCACMGGYIRADMASIAALLGKCGCGCGEGVTDFALSMAYFPPPMLK